MTDLFADLSSAGWTVVDLAFLSVLGLSVLMGIWRGLIREVLSLLGWVVAYFAAQRWGVEAGAWVPIGASASKLNALAGMVLVFVAAWVLWALLTGAVRAVISASGLGGADRTLGAVFGFFRGVLMLLALSTAVGMTPLAQSTVWQSSRSVPLVTTLMNGLRPLLDDHMLRFMPAEQLSLSVLRCELFPCLKEVL
jgi:membrane protein required for colicin V production